MKYPNTFFVLLLILIFSCVNINATTIGAIDFFGYSSQGSAVDTLKNSMIYFSDPSDDALKQQFFMKDNFYDLGLVYTQQINDNQPPLHYKLWIQNKPAQLITIIPGMGSHYSNQILMYLANFFYKAGYSVMAISSSFNWEFMENAATTHVPGLPVRDAKDSYYAIYKIISTLYKKYGKTRITGNILVGYSMGGLHSLIISELDKKYKLVDFERIVAINPPVDLLFGMRTLDKYFTNINSWPRATLRKKAYKAMRLFNDLVKNRIAPGTDIPLNSEEAQYIVGYINHSTIVDMIASIHKRGKANVIYNEYKWYNQEDMYREIENYDFHKYTRLFLIPHYSRVFKKRLSHEDLNTASSIKYLEKSLKNNEKVRVIHNEDDFLLQEEDQQWLWDTLDDNVIFFKRGGHLGNMFYPDVVKYILQAVNTKVKGGFEVIDIENERF